ncbi:hypothetical protein ZWY2020_017453 [Hordeum vulgare]|nr:hypothetical protein ZWY2020_017453 [Hordeum vulgare]
MSSVAAHMQEWQEVHGRPAGEVKQRVVQRWEPPKEGWIKVNSDGAVARRECGGSGGGAIIRDHQRAFLAAACHHFPHIVDPASAEILACRRALQVAAEVNAMRVHVELDAEEVVDMLNQPNRVLSTDGPWINEIKTAFGMFEEVKVSWARRSANGAAHKLAKVGKGDKLCKVWFGVPPDNILDVVSDEIPTNHD